MPGFQVAVTSAKGGTGTTTVSVALALAVAKRLSEAQFLDFDVEVPDASLLLKPTIEKTTPITAEAPEVLADGCTACGECQAACQYAAIRIVSGKADLHREMCNGCGCCRLVCPVGAIVERPVRIGIVESGGREDIVFHKGSLDPGSLFRRQLIHCLKAIGRSDIPTIRDCGSGTTSNVISSIRGSDYCIIVTEATPFGLHYLRLMAGVIGEVGVRTGIVINRTLSPTPDIEAFANQVGMSVLMRLPFSMEIATLGSNGVVLSEADGSWDQAFWDLYERIARGE